MNRLNIEHFHLASIETTLSRIKLKNQYYMLFLAMDGDNYDDDKISEFADMMIRHGMVYVSCWGPACSRVNDLFDLRFRDWEIDGNLEYPLVSTWHHGETLEEAIKKFLSEAQPDEAYQKRCENIILVSIENQDWSNIMKSFLP